MNAGLPAELIDVDAYLRPIIHMSPFGGKHSWRDNNKEPDEKYVLKEMALRLVGQEAPVLLTHNGREALNRALAATVKSRGDKVAIITPSNCGYVSSCVTKEIEKFCHWTFGAAPDADIVVLIHEFGRYVELPAQYRDKKVPVIEDCAYAMIDRSVSPLYGAQGDYVIYSLAKALPLQYGGLLVTPAKREALQTESSLTTEGRKFLLHELERHGGKLAAYNKARSRVYRRMHKAAREGGFKEILSVKKSEIAHGFLVALDPAQIDAAGVKAQMNDVGVESSVFYGGGGYFMPCHQLMGDAEIAYMFAHLRRAFDAHKVRETVKS